MSHFPSPLVSCLHVTVTHVRCVKSVITLTVSYNVYWKLSMISMAAHSKQVSEVLNKKSVARESPNMQTPKSRVSDSNPGACGCTATVPPTAALFQHTKRLLILHEEVFWTRGEMFSRSRIRGLVVFYISTID